MAVFEGNTVDEAIQKGLNQLGLVKEDVDISILEESKKGFLGIGKKNAKISLEPITKDSIEKNNQNLKEEPFPVQEEISASKKIASSDSNETNPEDLGDEEALTKLALYLTNISKELGAPALVRMERNDGLITMHLDSDKQGMLIGKHGKILNALQYLSQVFIHRVAENKLSVVVNVGDYREKRQAILERLAERTAEKVNRTGRPVFLEPMPAFERKQIHSVLSKSDFVKTHSEGEEPYRYLVVEPVKKYF